MSSDFEPYSVRLDQFEGPLDLLLYLIRKNKIDITDIPIAEITRQYLETLQEMRRLNLDLAGEYLVMASTLMFIKSRMLLPTEPDGDGEGEDPRKELVERLLMYERYQQAAQLLLERPILFEDTFPRLNREEIRMYEEDMGIVLGDVSVEELTLFFREVCRNAEAPFVHMIQSEQLSLQDHIQEIMDRLQTVRDGIWLRELLNTPVSRLRIIMLFLAILELARQRMIHLFQPGLYREIKIRAV
jgi:segregation and condensation protein A